MHVLRLLANWADGKRRKREPYVSNDKVWSLKPGAGSDSWDGSRQRQRTIGKRRRKGRMSRTRPTVLRHGPLLLAVPGNLMWIFVREKTLKMKYLHVWSLHNSYKLHFS